MDVIVIPDTCITDLKHGAKDQGASAIIYRDEKGEVHSVDLAVCGANYKAEHMEASASCIGQRKMDEGYFVFYTSGAKTKILFEKRYVGGFLHRRFLSGSRNSRFLSLQHRINQAGYTTLDLS